MTTKALPGRTNADAERQAHLEAYLRACVRHSVLSWSDLVGGGAHSRLFAVVASDLAAIVKRIGQRGITVAGMLLHAVTGGSG